MEKIDLKKKYPELFKASSKKITDIHPPELTYLMYDGNGHPEDNDQFQDAFAALFGISYTLKFSLLHDENARPTNYHDYVVPPVETLWFSTEKKFNPEKTETWLWTCMILQPDFINEELLSFGKNELIRSKNKKGDAIPNLEKLRLEVFSEGLSAQTMHIGPYNEVNKTYGLIEKHINDRKGSAGSKSHEIYLNDPRRTKPENLKTIVRMPYNVKQ